MPLPVAHGLLGASIIAAIHPQPTKRHALPLLAGACLANAADADFLLVLSFHSRSWHRGFSHSLMLALFICLLFLLSLGRRRIREALAYGLAFASHGPLDYVTTKVGGGVELLWPFSPVRLGLGWVGLSEIPSRMPALGIVKALAVELLLFAPLFVLSMWSRMYIWKRAGMAERAI